MNEHPDILNSKLHAFIDGELPENEFANMAAEIESDRDLARRVALFRADKVRLAKIYGQVDEIPIPTRWIDLIEQHAHKPRRNFALETFAALAATLLIFIGGQLIYRQMIPHEEAIVEEALSARNDMLPVKEVISASAPAQTRSAGHALTSALAMNLGVPNLSRMGYKLVGLRTYNNAHVGRAAELLYRGSDGRIFALYLRRPSGAPRFDQYKHGKLRVCIWQDDVIGAVMTGEMSAAEMQRLASLAYTGLES